ncbi:hypothetical protein AB0D49_28810 [Streptomyces sp. NPDC048290]|uniref:DUF7507 domain-containing protein n=1 Tax=Streptomyces sp. NPDC048290 TaxID=3155811 RepID=UPI003431A04E
MCYSQQSGTDGPGRPRHRGRTWAAALGTTAATAALLQTAVTPAAVAAPLAPDAARPRVAAAVPLVSETFTGATADPGFVAVGSACLTGAPQAPAPGPGNHPPGGCPQGASGPVPPDDAAPHGYLRLTDAAHDQSGAVLYDQAIPADAGLTVSFDQWQYGSTTPDTPADGLSFFLVDGSGSLDHPGAFGGSLGYAQKLPDDNPANPFLPGVDRGYLGVGLDVLGNYFGDWEQRGDGCADRSPAGTAFRVPAPGPNMVTLRGPGDGTTGYCFLTATSDNLDSTTGPWTSTLPGRLQGPTTSLPPGATPEEAEAALEESRRTVTVTLTPAPDPRLTVDIDFHDGTGTHQVLATDAPEPLPDTYKFGFAASTGQFTDVHLLRNVVIEPDRPLPALSLVKQVAQDPPLPDPLLPGAEVPFEYVVTNGGDTEIESVTVEDDRVTGVTCESVTLAPGASTTCTGTYTVTEADAEAGRVTNTASATGTSGGDPVRSPEDQVTLPVGAAAKLQLTKETDTSRAYRPGDTVTYTYTVTNAGGTTATGVHIEDDRVTGVTCESVTLAPGASTTCTGTYTVTEADARAGRVTNTAVALAAEDALRSDPARATIRTKCPPSHHHDSYGDRPEEPYGHHRSG